MFLRKMYAADWLVAGSIACNLAARALTQYYLAIHTSVSQTVASAVEVARVIEVNPVAKYLIVISGISRIFSYFLFPAILIAIYWYARRKWGVKRGSLLELYAAVVFFALFLDVFNDAVIVLAKVVMG